MRTARTPAFLAHVAAPLAGVLAMLAGLLVALAPDSHAAAAPPAYLVTCAHHGVTEPARYPLACGDENTVLTRTHWSSWGSGRAVGTARYVENDCTPDCAGGTFRHYRVRVRALDIATRDGLRSYGRIVVTFPHRHPSWVKHHRAVFDVTAG